VDSPLHTHFARSGSPDILPAMAAKPKIAIVGPGRLGTALALELRRAGYQIKEIISRDHSNSRRTARALARKTSAQLTTRKNAQLTTDLVWFCVPDKEIAAAARELAPRTQWKDKTALHSSGALASDELKVLRNRGAAVASVHPLMTFVRGSIPALKGVPFAIEGDAAAVSVARRITKDFGGEPFAIRKQSKAAYHAWGAFTSPLLITLLVTAEQVARSAGISRTDARKKMLPIVRQTINNYITLGPAGALSGPLVRGDAEILRKHLRALNKFPEARDLYRALSRSALRFLPVKKRNDLKRALAP
jgi:predicted short-subunit dehydrogenase-like oxidoreductase (DUF2520 family)